MYPDNQKQTDRKEKLITAITSAKKRKLWKKHLKNWFLQRASVKNSFLLRQDDFGWLSIGEADCQEGARPPGSRRTEAKASYTLECNNKWSLLNM